MTDFSRRSLITGLISFAVTAPAIVRAASLMPVKALNAVEFEWSPFYTAYPMDLAIENLFLRRIDAAYAIVKTNWEKHIEDTLYKAGTGSGGLGALFGED